MMVLAVTGVPMALHTLCDNHIGVATPARGD